MRSINTDILIVRSKLKFTVTFNRSAAAKQVCLFVYASILNYL